MVVRIIIGKEKVLELKEKAVSKKQQRFFGMVRAAQKGEGAASPEVAQVASEISKKDAKDFAKTKHKGLPEKVKVKEALSVKDTKKLNKASALDQSDDPKDQDRARARRTEVDYKDLLRQINSRKKPNKPAVSKMKEQNELAGKWKIDSSAHKKAQKKSKMRNLAKGNTNPNEKAAAEKKAGGPKLYGEAKVDQGRSDYGKASIRNYRRSGPGHGEPAMFDPENKRGKLIDKRREEHKARRGVKKAKVPAYKVSEGKTFDQWKKAAASALGRKKEEKKAEKAMDAGARAKRKLQRKEYAAKVSGSEDNVPDEMRD